MKIATFGPMKFVVSSKQIITFTDLTRSSSLNTEDVDNGKGKQRVKKKSIAADDLSFSIKLTNDNVNVAKEYNKWISLLNAAKAYYLIIGKQSYGSNKWLLTGCSVSDQEFLRNGVIKSATLALSFKESCNKKPKKDAKSTRNTGK